MKRAKKRRAATKRTSSSYTPPVNPLVAAWDQFSWKWFLSVIAGVTALLVLIVQYRSAHPIIEPMVPSTRGYVREYSEDTVKQKLDPISKWMLDYEGFRLQQTLEAAKSNLISLNRDLAQAKREYEANPTSVTLRGAMQQLESSILETRNRIDTYEKSLRERSTK